MVESEVLFYVLWTIEKAFKYINFLASFRKQWQETFSAVDVGQLVKTVSRYCRGHGSSEFL